MEIFLQNFYHFSQLNSKKTWMRFVPLTFILRRTSSRPTKDLEIKSNDFWYIDISNPTRKNSRLKRTLTSLGKTRIPTNHWFLCVHKITNDICRRDIASQSNSLPIFAADATRICVFVLCSLRSAPDPLMRLLPQRFAMCCAERTVEHKQIHQGTSLWEKWDERICLHNISRRWTKQERWIPEKWKFKRDWH